MLNKILLPSFIFLLLLKIVALNFTTFNLFGDEAQYWLWSKDIDFGYFSKPPFLSWIIRVYTEILGSSFFSLKLLLRLTGSSVGPILECSLSYRFLPKYV